MSLLFKVSLEDLYNGKVSKLAVNRNIICDQCNGKGGKEVSINCFLHIIHVFIMCNNTCILCILCIHVYTCIVYTCNIALRCVHTCLHAHTHREQ